ncbi:MAG: nitrilase-related carbon-nitrogen hydrolase, partial [Bacteroidales bacterium]
MDYGYVKVAAAIPGVKVADCMYNAAEIEKLIVEANDKGVEIITFPELALTAYTCGDLFAQQLLLDEAERGLLQIMQNTRQMDIISIIGLPVSVHGMLLNAAAVIQHGKVLGVVPKYYLPNYKEFYEMRWFTSGDMIKQDNVRLCGQLVPVTHDMLFETPKAIFGVEICEDVWAVVIFTFFGSRFGEIFKNI